MNNVEAVISLVENSITPILKETIDAYQVAFEVKKDDVHHLLSLMKANGFKQLSYLSAIDWPEENVFELVYIVFDWDRAVHVQIRTKLDRDNAVMNTIMPIYPGCQYYERETHEFFGVKFPGNPMFDEQLILEQWDDIPPLRKDFDPRAYSDKKFPVRNYSENHVVLNGQESKQKQRELREEKANKLRTGGKK
jgi:NADH-quinone oxidoreductase subunit C